MAKIGLFFGSFNPIHHGHLLMATHLREAANLDEIWMIVSPQNPFKINTQLADEQHRYKMVEIAIRDVDWLKVSDIEFQLEKPSYTHVTLKKLLQQFTEHQFHLIIGGDNVAKFNEWKEAQWIQDTIPILIYQRGNVNNNGTIRNASSYSLPLLDISSTDIRKRIQEKKTIRYFVPENVEQYILFHKLFRS